MRGESHLQFAASTPAQPALLQQTKHVRYQRKYLTWLNLANAHKRRRQVLSLSSFYIGEKGTPVVTCLWACISQEAGEPWAPAQKAWLQQPRLAQLSTPAPQAGLSQCAAPASTRPCSQRVCEGNPVFPFRNQVVFHRKNYQALGVINTTFENET